MDPLFVHATAPVLEAVAPLVEYAALKLVIDANNVSAESAIIILLVILLLLDLDKYLNSSILQFSS
jgi:hypothetical protein